MSKIITITGHAAVDYRVEIDALLPGKTMLANQATCFAGGKGINVAKAITSLGLPVHALGFIGTQSISSFSRLESELFSADYTLVDGATRVNLTLNDAVSETHIRTTGFSVAEADCRRLVQCLDDCIAVGDIVVISGSLPPGAPADFFATLINHCHQQGAHTLLDSHGAGLREGLLARPYGCKPNVEELAELVAMPLTTANAIITAAKTLTCSNIIVSQAEQGLLAINDHQTLALTMPSINTPIVSSIGCGDALVAGLAIGLMQQLDYTEMMVLAIACASANLASAEPGIIDADLVSSYKNQVQITTI